MSVKRTIALNTAFNAAGRIWEAIVGIGLTVYTIDRVGLEGFGLWSLVSVFTGYAALLDFGVSSAFAKYIATFTARGDRAGVSAVVSTGVYFYAALGVVMVILGWPFIDLLLEWTLALMRALNPGSAQVVAGNALWEEARFLLRGALVLFVVTNAAAPFPALQMGLQRMGITNALGFAGSVLKVAATVAFLELGYGVRGLLYTSALLLAVMTLANVVVAYRIFPGLRCTPAQMRWPLFKTLLAFGWRSQVARLANLVNFQTDRVVVALASGGRLDLVGLYRVGEDLASKVRQVPALLVSALVPAVSDLDARDDRARLEELYLRSTKYVAAVTVPLTVYSLSVTDLLLCLYGDKGSMGTAGWVARIMLVGYALNVLPGPGVSVALGKGNAGLPMMAGLLSMSSNLVLTVILYLAVGFYGIPVATALALGLSTTWFFGALRREVAVAPRTVIRVSLCWPVLASLPGAAGCLLVAWAAAPYGDRVGNLAIAGACGIVFALGYALCLRLTPFLDTRDVDFLRDTLRLDRVPGFRFMTAGVTADRAGMGVRLRAYAERDGRGYPDWALRYLPVLRRLGRQDWGDRRVLEIGANENGFARFSGARVIAVDIERAQLLAARGAQGILPVQADIGALPFRSGAFDTVICMDTYEHIPRAHRRGANREIIRVLKADGTAVIGFPSGEAAFAAETRIRDAYRDLTGGSVRWLEEHVAMGLPDATEVEQDLAEAGGSVFEVRRESNASLWAWEWMWRVLMCNWPGRGNAVMQVLLRWSVPLLSRIHGGVCYRTILWVRPRSQKP